MKKLDFRNFSVPTGITRQTREVFDAREQIADLLYTRVSGIKAHRLAFKIFESTGETEFSDEETGMIHMAVERYCLPNVIDALNEILGGSESAGPCTPEFYRRGGLGDRHLAERCEITARGEGRQDGERPPGTDREACERCRRPCRGCRQESGRSRSRTGGKDPGRHGSGHQGQRSGSQGRKCRFQGGTDYGSSHRRGYRTLFLMDGNRQRFT